MFEKDYEIIGTFIGYLKYLLEIVAAFINSLRGVAPAEETPAEGGDAGEGEGA